MKIAEVNKHLLYLATALALTSCGGDGDNNKKTDTNNPVLLNSVEYLDFWKSELTELNKISDNNWTYRVKDGALDNSEAAPSGGGTSDDFSTTNVQVAGVDEADILKFDGEVLLSLNLPQYYYHYDEVRSTKRLLRTFSEDMLEGNANEDADLHLPLPDDQSYTGLLTHDDYAVLVGGAWNYGWGVLDMALPFVEDCFRCIGPYPDNSEVTLDIWQYKDDNGPKKPDTTKVVVEGNRLAVRSIENKIYLVTSYSPWLPEFYYYPSTQDQVDENRVLINSLTADAFAPKITIDGEEKSLLANGSCQIPEEHKGLGFLPSLYVVSEIDMQDPTNYKSICVVDHIQESYVGLENIYLLGNDYDSNYSSTNILVKKISITDAGLEYKGEGRVLGSLSGDGYQLAEINGDFAMVNTVYQNDNYEPFFHNQNFYHQLTVLEEGDSGLKVKAQIPNDQRPEPIGKPGELIYAVRFMNQRAYVVTFDKVDPLYVIDLSDTSDPEILGELEIPGYSDYLHVVNDNLVFGIGKNAINDGQTTWYQGLNVRLFDVSDPSAPQTLVNMDYGLRGSESALLNDPHALAFTLNDDTGIARLAFPVSINGDEAERDPDLPLYHRYDWKYNALLQMEIDTSSNTMSEVGRYIFENAEDNGEYHYWSYQERSVINGSSIYFAYKSKIDVLDWGGDEALRSFDIQSD